MTLLLGRRYNRTKKQGARTDLTSRQNAEKLNTSATLAKEYGVDPTTIQRAGKFAESVEKLGMETEIAKGKVKATKKAIIQAAKALPENATPDQVQKVKGVMLSLIHRSCLHPHLHRRHLQPSQIAMVGDKVREVFDLRAKERQKSHGGTAPGKTKDTPGNVTGSVSVDARDEAGKAVGVSGSLIDRARKVREKGVPELAKAVEEGRMSVTAAAKLTKEDPEVQRKEASAATFSGVRHRSSLPEIPAGGNPARLLSTNSGAQCT